MERTHTNGELRLSDTGKEVTLLGWVAKRRNFGALVFIDLRDRTGITQLVFDETLAEQIKDVRNEYILQVSGTVLERKDKNPKLATGDIEVKVNEVSIINSAETTPIIVADDTDALEDTRLKYRYLDLRRPIMQNKLMMRHKITHSMREYLDSKDFIEIENMDIMVETLLRKFQIEGNLQLYFAFSALQGDIWREGQIHYYMQSREYGKHNRPHVHVNAGDRYSAAIDILTGEILAGEISGKYMKQIKNKVEKNRGFLIDCWNNMTDGINVDIDYRFGITSFRNVLTDYEGVKERN